jgi:hypothetical protein
MARTNLTSKVAVGSYGDYTIALAAYLTMTAADVANLNQFSASGNDLVIAQNSGASTYTVTITSAPDTFGRSRDIATYGIAAGEFGVFGPFKLLGWVQADGKIYLQASNAAVKFGVVALP